VQNFEENSIGEHQDPTCFRQPEPSLLLCRGPEEQQNGAKTQRNEPGPGSWHCKIQQNCFGPVHLQTVRKTLKKPGSTRELPKMTSLVVGTSMRAPINGASGTRTRAREDSYTLELLPNVQLSASKKGHIQEVQSVERKWEQNGNRCKQ
jgi:hypothetical protein